MDISSANAVGRLLWCLAICQAVLTSTAAAQVPSNLAAEAGTRILKSLTRDGIDVGRYVQYLPTSYSYTPQRPTGTDPLPIMVLVHGSISCPPTTPPMPNCSDAVLDAQAVAAAERMVDLATARAEADRFMVIAPVFDQTDFGNKGGPLAGYRGGVGRHRNTVVADGFRTDPDGFLNRIVDAYQHAHPEVFGRKLLLYGHSAGAQFLARYLAKHPDRVQAMVLSSSGTYVFPDDAYTWPDGTGTLSKTLSWQAGNASWGSSPSRPLIADRAFYYSPNSHSLSRIARAAVRVVVGDGETCHGVPEAGGQPGYVAVTCPQWECRGVCNCDSALPVCVGKAPDGTCCPSTPPAAGCCTDPVGNGTRWNRGRLWVDAMRDHAGLSSGDPGIAFVSLPDIAHNAESTLPYALDFLVSHATTTIDDQALQVILSPVAH